MVSYLDALGMVEVHGMVEVRTIGNDAICGIQVANHPGYKEVFIFTPDEPDTLARYFLYPPRP